MENLATLRKSRHLKQEDVATILGVTKQAYSKYERGDREASYETLCKLSEYFNVSIDYLIGNSTNPTKLEQWTAEEIAQGVGNHPIVLSDRASNWLSTLYRADDVLGEDYVDAIMDMIDINVEKKLKDQS